MKFKYFLIPILAIIGSGWLQAQSADSAPLASPGTGLDQHRRHHHAWIWRELNLTDAQKMQIKSIKQTGQTRPALAAVLKAKLKLQQDIDANSEQAMIAADASALATAESQFASVRATELGKIKVILTDEQKTTLQNLRQKREERMQDMINKLTQPTT